MDERFKIYVEQLRDGQVEKIAEVLEPSFLEVHESELSFVDPIDLQGEAYLADDELILHLNVSTFALMPCKICNDMVKAPIEIDNSYHAIPLGEVKGGIFNLAPLLREQILLELPLLVECHEGHCPKRQAMQKYFKKDSGDAGEDGYQPFADLDDQIENQ